MIRLFEVKDKGVIPTENCYTIKWLKAIMDEFPENYIKVYSYIFYMSCPNQDNPYFHTPHELREDAILSDIEADFSTENTTVIHAVENCQKLFETPTVRAYKSVKVLLENLGEYMENATISAGRDGNITALVSAAKNFDNLRQSFKGVAKDLEDEQESRTRGGQSLGYDQM